MHATGDRMNLAWRTVFSIAGRIHTIAHRMNPTVRSNSCDPASDESRLEDSEFDRRSHSSSWSSARVGGRERENVAARTSFRHRADSSTPSMPKDAMPCLNRCRDGSFHYSSIERYKPAHETVIDINLERR
jgi:hypothetical protein